MLSFDRIVELAVIGLRRRRIEVAHRRLDQTSRNRNEEQIAPKATPPIFRNWRKAPLFRPSSPLACTSTGTYDHCYEKVPKPDDSCCRNIAISLIDPIYRYRRTSPCSSVSLVSALRAP